MLTQIIKTVEKYEICVVLIHYIYGTLLQEVSQTTTTICFSNDTRDILLPDRDNAHENAIEGTAAMPAKSCLSLCDPRTVALQALLSMKFSSQEYWRATVIKVQKVNYVARHIYHNYSHILDFSIGKKVSYIMRLNR